MGRADFGSEMDPLGLFPKQEKESTQEVPENIDKSYIQRLRRTLRNFLIRLRDPILNRLDEVLQKDEGELSEFENSAEKSASLSEAAGKYMDELSRHSILPPRKEYQHDPTDSDIRDSASATIDDLSVLKAKASRKEYLEARRTALATPVEKGPEFSERTEDECTLQFFDQTVVHSSGEFFISEEVTNTLNKNANSARSNLVLSSAKERVSLDLATLLPEGFSFAPGDITSVEDQVVTEEGRTFIKHKFVRRNLRDYKGIKGSKGEFALLTPTNKVVYGDLIKTGGMLKLFHEITHAWQNMRYGSIGREDYERFYNQIIEPLRALDYIQAQIDKGETVADPELMVLSVRLQKMKVIKDLQTKGIFILDTLASSTLNKFKRSKNTISLKDASGLIEEKHDVYSPELYNLSSDFVFSERNAWAHAIMLVRFLRRHGFDVEPDLKTIDDFKAIIEPALGSYQELMDMQIEAPELRKFKR